MQQASSIMSLFRSINAITLATGNMRSSVEFYKKIGLVVSYGGADSPFSTMSPESIVTRESNRLHVNLFFDKNCQPPRKPNGWNNWGRFIIFVDDVDKVYTDATAKGIQSVTGVPKDAVWGERYFHVRDPFGHEISFATPVHHSSLWPKQNDGIRGTDE